MTNGNLMKVESIAECSEHSAILLTCIKRCFVLKTNFWGLERPFLDRFYCIPVAPLITSVWVFKEAFSYLIQNTL